jgi:hypothetical protein
MHSRIFFSLITVLAFAVAGCNGQEDFSDAIVAGNIIDGDNPNPNFNPDDACQSRVVGNLVDSGIVANIGYECGGYRGYTGEKGIPSEISQNRFVCPLYSTSVTFFLGGKNDRREYLGKAHFRKAGPAEENFDDEGNPTCQYNTVDQEYIADSVYDADGPYLFSIADIYDGPVRVDVITDNATNEEAAQNLSALLTGLDSSPDESLVLIDDEAHRVIFELEFEFADDFFDKPFVDFVADTAATDEAQDYLDLISAGAGPAAIGMLPTNASDVEQVLVGANFSTAAGIYQFDLRQENYLLFGYAVEQGQSPPPANPIFNAEALLTDYLLINLQSPAMSRATPADPNTADQIPFVFAQDYFPFTLVDRHNRLIGGGAFDVARITLGAGGGIDHLCGEQPVYLALSGAAGLASDLTFQNMTFEPVAVATQPEVGDAKIPGRFMEGVAYSGLKLDVNGSQTDYEFTYSEPTHVFDDSTDQSLINTTSLCGETIDDQVIFGFRRQGIVMPKLDPLVMDHFFAAPGKYSLNFLARSVAADPDPDVVTKDTLNVTIHEDGTILTDLNANDNASYDVSGLIPTGEYVVGMVSSILAGEDNPATAMINEYITEAQINILVFSLGEQSLAQTLPAYGSHFRARIVPDTTCSATNALWFAGDDTLSQHAYWFDTYNITNWLRGTGPTTTDSDRYEALRTIAYGFIEGVRTDCP